MRSTRSARALAPAEQPHALGKASATASEVVHALRFAASRRTSARCTGRSTPRSSPTSPRPKAIRDWTADATLFMDNWRIAYRTLSLQSEVEQEKMLREQMYVDRLESIATMVTGIAHEINTPLGRGEYGRVAHRRAAPGDGCAPSNERGQEDREDLGPRRARWCHATSSAHTC